jgi:hypothetical protein
MNALTFPQRRRGPYWVIRGSDGRPVVSSIEPATWEERLAGPFSDHLDAFDEMERIDEKEARRAQLFSLLWPILACVVVVVAAGWRH